MTARTPHTAEPVTPVLFRAACDTPLDVLLREVAAWLGSVDQDDVQSVHATYDDRGWTVGVLLYEEAEAGW